MLALSRGGYSLRVLGEIVDRQSVLPRELEQHFLELSAQKKSERMTSLCGLGFVTAEDERYELTERGRVAANTVALIARLADFRVPSRPMKWLVLVLAAFVLAILSQAALLRIFRVRHGIVAFVCAGVLIGLTLMAALLIIWPLDRVIAGTLLYAFLCELWMFILSVTFSSVAANLMMHLRMRPIALKELIRLFDDRVMIQNRIGWLTNIGAAVIQDDKLVATSGGRKLARPFDAFRSFFGHL